MSNEALKQSVLVAFDEFKAASKMAEQKKKEMSALYEEYFEEVHGLKKGQTLNFTERGKECKAVYRGLVDDGFFGSFGSVFLRCQLVKTNGELANKNRLLSLSDVGLEYKQSEIREINALKFNFNAENESE